MGRSTKITVRSDLSTNWSAQQLADGEIGFEYNTGRFKIGRKNTTTNQLYTWNALGYSAEEFNPTLLVGSSGGTGVANSEKTINLAGNLAISGGYAITLNAAGAVTATFPPSGLLAKADGSNFFNIPRTVFSKYTMAPSLWFSVPSGDLTVANNGGMFGNVDGVALDALTIYEFSLVWLAKASYAGSTSALNKTAALTFSLPSDATIALTGQNILTSTIGSAVNGTNASSVLALGPSTRNTSTLVIPSVFSPGNYGSNSPKYITLKISGTIRMGSTAGNFNPLINLLNVNSTNPATFTLYAGSYIELRPIGSSATTSKGNWS